MKTRWMAAGVLAAAALTALPAQAGIFDGIFGSDHRYPRRGRYGEHGYEQSQYTRGMGYERGFRDGLKHGRKDWDKRRGFNFAHDNDYRDADNGYRSSYG